ncbi:FkbM family methyltransferase [Solibacillus sp. FSL K6-4121]|uniref:FkbM family methyltransferase n=1 Tax=Solibacillus sp. FSL K6-4121 TaxID=2921505 RepID=UPI0030FC599C
MEKNDLNILKIKNTIIASMNQAKKLDRTQSVVRENSSNNEEFLQELALQNSTVNRSWDINPNFKITSHRKTSGRFIVLLKKIIRKCISWYIEPVFEKQRQYNIAATKSLNALLGTVNNLSHYKNELGSELNSIKKDDKGLQNEINYLKLEIQNLKTSNSELLAFKEETRNSFLQDLQVMKETIETESQQLNALKEKVGFDYQELIKIQQKMQEEFNVIYNEFNPLNKKEQHFFNKKTYSQSGEDSILMYILKVLNIPFEAVRYLDLGANHAKEFSNTNALYEFGARGILVEANPQLIPELKFYRNEDIILNKAIAKESEKTIDFYILSGDGLSTTDFNQAQQTCEINPDIKIEKTISVKTTTYNEIVEKYLDKAPTILSVDIEGMDFEILETIDFVNYRPLLIIVEMIEYDTNLNYMTKNVEIKDFLDSNGYDEYAYTGINSIFIDKTYLKSKFKK